MSNAIEVKNLTKRYAEFTLDNVSFELPEGYIMGLVGKNGAGKTTIINSLLNMISHDGGLVELLGKDVTRHETELKQDIGVVFDSLFFINTWTLKDVEGAISRFYTNWDKAKFAGYIKKFGLSEKKKLSELSYGMKVKVMLAAAFSHDAKLLILDEPTSGLDPVARDEFLEILEEFIATEGHSVLFSTHITSDLEKITDYITVVSEGKIFYTGLKDELIEKYTLIKGEAGDLTDEIKQKAVGIKTNAFGFTGMIPTEYLNVLPKNVVTEKSTIEEILVYAEEGNK